MKKALISSFITLFVLAALPLQAQKAPAYRAGLNPALLGGGIIVVAVAGGLALALCGSSSGSSAHAH